MSSTKAHKQIIWLMGGLGNQLFQVQFGNWLRQTFNRKIEYNIALTRKSYVTAVMGWSIHDYVLEDVVDLDGELFIDELNPITILCSKLRFLPNHAFFHGLEGVNANSHRNLFGYFQNKLLSEEMFDTCSLRLRQKTSLHYDFVMHLRGGDVNNPVPAEKYYGDALELCNPSLIHVVTDSRDLLKRIADTHSKHSFIDVSGSVVTDFNSLASARKIIVAPSTFSWWAARLGASEEIWLPNEIHEKLGKPKLNNNVRYELV